MANFQYKSSSGGSFADVPLTAYGGTYEGSFEVLYPPTAARDGTGKPCASIGKPKVEMKSVLMSACGLDWWQDFFADDVATSTEFWIKGKNPRTNLWVSYTGWLLRPAWSRVQVGSASVNTLYFDATITVDLCDTV